MDKKILFLDLDLTLLNDKKEITLGNREALKKILLLGHGVVITSGRALKSTLIKAEELGLDGSGCFIIAFNGALIYDCGIKKSIYKSHLEPAEVFLLFDEAKRRGIHIQTYDDSDVLVEPRCDDQDIKFYCHTTSMSYKVITDIHKDLKEPPAKILMINRKNREILEEMREWIDTSLAEKVDTFYSSPYYLEAISKGVNKGYALTFMAKHLRVPLDHTVAVGDAENDLTMLKTAGIGVAMANAIPKVKECADYVTENDNNHDGVAEVIEKFFL